jgi:hypothetical protein
VRFRLRNRARGFVNLIEIEAAEFSRSAFGGGRGGGGGALYVASSLVVGADDDNDDDTGDKRAACV